MVLVWPTLDAVAGKESEEMFEDVVTELGSARAFNCFSTLVPAASRKILSNFGSETFCKNLYLYVI